MTTHIYQFNIMTTLTIVHFGDFSSILYVSTIKIEAVITMVQQTIILICDF